MKKKKMAKARARETTVATQKTALASPPIARQARAARRMRMRRRKRRTIHRV